MKYLIFIIIVKRIDNDNISVISFWGVPFFGTVTPDVYLNGGQLNRVLNCAR